MELQDLVERKQNLVSARIPGKDRVLVRLELGIKNVLRDGIAKMCVKIRIQGKTEKAVLVSDKKEVK